MDFPWSLSISPWQKNVADQSISFLFFIYFFFPEGVETVVTEYKHKKSLKIGVGNKLADKNRSTRTRKK